MKEIFPQNKEINILDIGCGWGSWLYSLIKYGYHNIDAIDIINKCIEFVKNKFGINAYCVDIFETIKNYDVITAFDVIEHFHKQEIISITKMIYDSLNSGGVFYLQSS